MVKPAAYRQAVGFLRLEFEFSERRACSALGFPLWKRKCPMLAHTLYWAREVTDPSGEMLAHYSKHVTGIERAIDNYGRSAR